MSCGQRRSLGAITQSDEFRVQQANRQLAEAAAGRQIMVNRLFSARAISSQEERDYFLIKGRYSENRFELTPYLPVPYPAEP